MMAPQQDEYITPLNRGHNRGGERLACRDRVLRKEHFATWSLEATPDLLCAREVTSGIANKHFECHVSSLVCAELLNKLAGLSRLTIVLLRRILAFFPAGNKKVSTSLGRAITAGVVSLFRLLLIPLRCLSESIRRAMDSPPDRFYFRLVAFLELRLLTAPRHFLRFPNLRCRHV